jgi:5'-3' exonuclease, N-terminal resolvase-like domain
MLTALVDADILVYSAALEAEHEHRWADDLYTYHANPQDAYAAFERELAKIMEETGATDFLLALSEPVASLNWRLGVLPSYKSNRKTTRRPLVRRAVNEWVMETYRDKVYLRPGLEGDDVLGILLTHPTLVKGDKLVVSIDKDFKTIPGQHYNQKKDKHFEVTPDDADRYHIYQALIGDATDGYAGCPGVGPVAAEKLMDGVPTGDLWETVVKAFTKAKLGEEAALIQARVARICRATDYDFKQKKVILWTP